MRQAVVRILILGAILLILLWPSIISMKEISVIEPKIYLESPKILPVGEKWTASWYSRDECLGCRGDRLMANGQVLDDNAATCAFNKVKLGTKIKIVYGDREAECVVTDRIGIMGRIDLTPAVFEKLGNLNDGLLIVSLFY